MSIKSIIQNFFPVNFHRNSQSFEQNVDNLKGPRSGPSSKGSEGSKGKVDGASPRRLWPPAGGGLCKRVVFVLVFLFVLSACGRRVRKFDGPSGRGLWYRPTGDEFYMPPIGGSKNRTTGLRPLEMHPFWCCAPPSPRWGDFTLHLPSRLARSF